MLNFHKTILDNGLRIITSPQKETKAMTLLFLVGTGSRFEDKAQNGISHFLEHILFKGTAKYRGPQALAEALDSIGAEFNAYTSEEYTGFYVNAAAEHFPLALDVLYEMFYWPRFSKTDIEREKGVIAEEINMYRDLPQRHVYDVLKTLLYGDSPMGRNIAGTHTTVASFSKRDFVDYQASFYTPDNIIIAIAGNPLKFDWGKAIQQKLGKKEGQRDRSFEGIVVSQTEPQVLIEKKSTDQTHLALALRSIAETDERWPILQVLNTILGGGMSSRLFSEIREKRGLAYYVRSIPDAYHDTGNLVITAGVRNDKAQQAVKIILTELQRFKNDLVSARELNKAKENFKGQSALRLEQSSEIATYLAQTELYFGKVLPPDDLVKKVMAVSKSEIRDFAQTFFQQENLNLAAVGPFVDKDFLPILRAPDVL